MSQKFLYLCIYITKIYFRTNRIVFIYPFTQVKSNLGIFSVVSWSHVGQNVKLILNVEMIGMLENLQEIRPSLTIQVAMSVAIQVIWHKYYYW